MSEVLFYNGTILTMEKEQPRAQAVLEVNGRIKGVGSYEELKGQAGEHVKEVNLKGRTLLPGFIDSHSHLTAAAFERIYANASPPPKGKADSKEALLEVLKKQFRERKWKKGEWFIAMGYDPADYPDKKQPTKVDLDQITENYPVVVMHASGHCAVLNSKALELAGITSGYQAESGGGVDFFPGTKEPNGFVKELTLMNQVSTKIPEPSWKEVLEAIYQTCMHYASYGITTVQDGRLKEEQLRMLRAADKAGNLPLDVVCYLEPMLAAKELPKQPPVRNPYEGRIRLGGCKLFLDGSPQARTAWLSRPYETVEEGMPQDYCGIQVMEDEEAVCCFRECIRNSWQVNVHTNGDEAIEQFIRCYGKAEEAEGKKELRPVAIHCQTVRKDQLPRMKDLGIYISFFLDHIFYWGDYHYETILGPERAGRISPAREALDLGINITLHQDTPVAEPNVLLSVHNGVNRVTRKGRVLGRELRITPQQALYSVTLGAARQIFEEQEKGSIAVGKKADFVILNRNPVEVPKTLIRDIAVEAVIKEGKVIYRKR